MKRFEKELLSELDKVGLPVYKVKMCLDEDCDILLETSDVKDFIDFCKKSKCDIVFMSYRKESKEEYYIDAEDLEKELYEYIEKRVMENMFGDTDDIDIEVLVESYEDELAELVNERNMLVDSLDWDTPIGVDVYAVYNGANVGISFESDKKTPSDQILDSGIIGKFIDRISKEIDSYCEKVSEEHSQLRQKEREERQKRYDQAIREIEELLKNGNELMECTNGKLRHGYARRLADSYQEKYDVYITISEVDVLVETTYKERRSNG